MSHNLAIYTSHDANMAWRDQSGQYHVLELERLTGRRYYSLDTDPDCAVHLDPTARWIDRRSSYACLFPSEPVTDWLAHPGDRICGHHDAHAACAFFQSHFEESLVLSFDGGGPNIDGQTEHFTIYRASRQDGLTRLKSVEGLDLGTRYRDAASFVPEISTPGSNPMAWPGKAMALAAYGRPDMVEEAHDYLRGVVPIQSHQNDADWLASVQDAFEMIVMTELQDYQEYRNSLCVTGGCALNVKLNQRLHDEGWNVYVPPNPSDCGLALGMLLWQDRPSGSVHAPFCGHDFFREGHCVDPEPALEEVGSLLAHGKVVGFIHGRAESGPRALGHRSILAPDIPGMRERLNRIKGRASFRPVAPMIRSVHAGDYFDLPHNTTMAFAPQARFRGECVHVDRSARLQVVTPEENPIINTLLELYESHWPELPLLLNTSLNQPGRPLVGDLASAFACYQDLDALYINGDLHKHQQCT